MNRTPRNLIICSDGTDNRFGRHNTNVFKLYQILESSENRKCFYAKDKRKEAYFIP